MKNVPSIKIQWILFLSSPYCSKDLNIIVCFFQRPWFRHITAFAKFLIAYFPIFDRRDNNISHFPVIRIHFIFEGTTYSNLNQWFLVFLNNHNPVANWNFRLLLLFVKSPTFAQFFFYFAAVVYFSCCF